MPKIAQRHSSAAMLLVLALGPARWPSIARAQAPTTPVVIYLHGRIIEDQGPNAVSPEFGPYVFGAIVDSLRATGARVIAELRPSGTDAEQWATRVARQVDSLIGAGVDPRRITVVGFSKGGGIAVMTAAKVRRAEVGYVFLAACSPESYPGLTVAGRMLSVYEASDPLGQSCEPLFRRATPGSETVERRIGTGRKHGAFYQPLADWLGPVRRWIAGGGHTPASMDSLLSRLVGRWRMVGKVQGEAVTYRLDVARTIRNQFVELRMEDVATPSQYQGRVFIGVDSAESRYLVHWLDNFGAGASIPHGVGEARGDTVQFSFQYRSGTFRDTFSYDRSRDRWHFLIEAADGTGGWNVFGDYDVRRRR